MPRMTDEEADALSNVVIANDISSYYYCLVHVDPPLALVYV
jgi:hypothetical protein